MKHSLSEDRGLSLLQLTDKAILSAGISTGGFAEVRMAQQSTDRKIIATTIDQKGLAFTEEIVKRLRFEKQIETRYEDLRDRWNYPPDAFDFIYARLVLHYLSKKDLDDTLKNFSLSLRHGCKVFIVVQSAKNIDPRDPNLEYDADTGLTIQSKYATDGSFISKKQRYWHTPESIGTHVKSAGFVVESIEEYKEQLYNDYARTDGAINRKETHVIEVVATKP